MKNNESNKILNLAKSNLRELEISNSINENWEQDISKKIDSLYKVGKKFLNELDNKFISKISGSFYTNLYHCKEIISNSIFLYLNNIYNIKKPTKFFNFNSLFNFIKKNIIDFNILNELTFLDPTCGGGSFLFSYYLVILEINIKLNNNCKNYDDLLVISKKIINNIYGIDLNKETLVYVKNLFDISHLFLFKQYTCKMNLIVIDFLEFNIKNIDKKIDIICGNPPFIELKNNFIKYRDFFLSYKSGNLYALVYEKCLSLVKKNGIISLITPLSSQSTKRSTYFRSIFKKESGNLFFISFADRPSSLFSKVHVRISLVIFSYNDKKNFISLYTTNYIRWYKKDENNLFDKISLFKVNKKYLLLDSVPKVGNIMDFQIIDKFNSLNLKCEIYNIYELPENIIFIGSRIGSWPKVFLNKNITNEIFKIKLPINFSIFSVFSIFSSSLFYCLWIIHSDCWHVLKSFSEKYLSLFHSISEKSLKKLDEIGKILWNELEKNKEEKNTAQSKYEYKHKKSKIVIDNIDKIIIKELFPDNWQEIYKYIINFEYKYRMGLKNE